MHHRIKFVRGKNRFDLRTNRKIRLAEGGSGRNGGPVALLEIVERDHLMPAGQQNFRADTPDIAGGAGH
jgi:hypothetical protein